MGHVEGGRAGENEEPVQVHVLLEQAHEPSVVSLHVDGRCCRH